MYKTLDSKNFYKFQIAFLDLKKERGFYLVNKKERLVRENRGFILIENQFIFE